MLEVVEPGLLTTVQDGGRVGAIDLGVPVGGACDPWSLSVANVLVGNRPDAAALEMTVLGATLRALEDCLLSVAGADMATGIEVGRGVVVRRGETLSFGTAAEGSGVRTYLAIGGGIDVPEVLGSGSTSLVGGFGGYEGRPLHAGDVVRALPSSAPALERSWPAAVTPRTPGTALVRVVRGTETDGFDDLVERSWTVSGRGDRQGIRLAGEPIAVAPRTPLLSRGVTWGTIQLPPDGAPIVLLADHQTVGGYPVVAVAITADRPILGQLGPGDEIRFSEVEIGAAQAALREQAAEFERLRQALR